MFRSVPIKFARSGQKGSTVKFTVEQTWKEGESLDWIAVMHLSLSGQSACERTEDFSDSTQKYTATCGEDGIAEVALFVRDDSFDGPNSTGGPLPSICRPLDYEPSVDEGKLVMFFFSVPCNPGDESFCTETPSSPPTKTPFSPPTMTPFSPPTKTPFSLPTQTPETSRPTSDPTYLPTWGVTGEEPVCVAEARLDSDSTEDSENGKYRSNPINIVEGEQKGSTVKFSVEQAWSESGSLNWIAVMHEQIGGEAVCHRTEDLLDNTEEYTAVCGDDGIAEVALFVRDDTFEGLNDISAQVPLICKPFDYDPSADEGKLVMFFFSVPCVRGDEAFCAETPSSSPTKAPTDAPTKLPTPGGADTPAPTFNPTVSPTKTPTDAPTGVPTWDSEVEEPICIQEARLDSDTSEVGRNSMFERTPIKIVDGEQKGSTIKFFVEQTWKQGETLSWISVMHETSGGELACHITENFLDTTVEFTAKCSDMGIAVVVLFVGDETFEEYVNIQDQIPSKCKPSGYDLQEDKENLVTFTFSLPCDTTDESFCEEETLCPDNVVPTFTPTVSPTKTPTDVPTLVPTWDTAGEEPVCVQYARLDGDSTETGKNGGYGSLPITILEQNGSTVMFVIQQTWKDDGSVDWLAVMHETAAEELVCSQSENFSSETDVFTSSCDEGVAEVAIFVRDETFEGLADITPQIPHKCEPSNEEGKKVMFYFSLPCDPTDESFCEENSLCPDTAAPTADTTDSPTFTPTSSPTKTPTDAPTLVPTWGVQGEEPVCIQYARLDGDSTETDKNGGFKALPIAILEQSGSTVKYIVEQTWKDGGSVDWLAVMYETAGEELVCSQSENFSSQTDAFTSICNEGIAEVAIFVRDETFEGLADITPQIPHRCNPLNEAGKKVMFYFSVPCDPTDETFCEEKSLCPDTAAPTADTTDSPTFTPTALPTKTPTDAPTLVPTWEVQEEEPVCIQYARLDGDSTETDKNGGFKALPIAILEQSGSTVKYIVEQTWKDGGSVDWLAVMYETAGEELVCSQSENFSSQTDAFTSVCNDGIAEVAIFVRDETFEGLADITPQIPRKCEPSNEEGKKVVFYFSLPCDPTDESFCDENSFCPDTIAPTSDPTASPTFSPTVSPTKTPTDAPTLVPTWRVQEEEPICVQHARLDGDSTEQGKSGGFKTIPITILEQSGSTVKYVVEQTWKDGGSVDWLAVMHETAGEELVCDQSENFSSQTDAFTSICDEGVAEVAIFVRDEAFVGLADITPQIPHKCEPSDDAGEKVMFYFSLPCDPTDESFCEEDSLCPDTVAPTADPTSSPTFTPTSSPTKIPTDAPTLVPTWGVQEEEPVCVQHARLDGDTTETGKNGGYTTLPIKLLEQSGSTVQYVVEQTWKDGGSVDWLAVMHETAGEELVCSQSENFSSQTDVFTSVCDEGVAEVAIFVRDETFEGLADITHQIPHKCEPSNEEGKKVMFYFSLPCDPTDESFCEEDSLCPDTVAPTADPTSSPTFTPTSSPTKIPTDSPTLVPTWGVQEEEPVCVQHARLDGDTTETGKKGGYTTLPIKLLEQSGSTVKYVVEQTWKDGGSVDWLAVMHETVGEELVCDRSENFSSQTDIFTSVCDEGVAEVAIFVRDETFEGLADITPQIPHKCEPSNEEGKKVMFYFSLPCDPTDESFCEENSLCPDTVAEIAKSIANRDDVEDHFTLMTNVVTCDSKHVENFESAGQVESWENGEAHYDEIFTTYLGRLGLESPAMTKMFVMPRASMARMELDFYDIDGVSEDDKIYVRIQGKEKEIKLDESTTKYHGDFSVTVTKKELPSGARDGDHVYGITIDIDGDTWMDYGNKLPVSFKVKTKLSVNEESYGIDNFSIQIIGCGGGDSSSKSKSSDSSDDRRMLENESSDENRDESNYCRSQDYPCGEAPNMVHVCHYSNRLGYQTFCVPEADSNILRFYSNDYCGPCASGASRT